jgi:UDP-N-acetylenolpyruvoylglucosamine reductase
LKSLRNAAEHLQGLAADEMSLRLLRLVSEDFAHILHGLGIVPKKVETASAGEKNRGIVSILAEQGVEGLECLPIPSGIGFAMRGAKGLAGGSHESRGDQCDCQTYDSTHSRHAPSRKRRIISCAKTGVKNEVGSVNNR